MRFFFARNKNNNRNTITLVVIYIITSRVFCRLFDFKKAKQAKRSRLSIVSVVHLRRCSCCGRSHCGCHHFAGHTSAVVLRLVTYQTITRAVGATTDVALEMLRHIEMAVGHVPLQ